MSIARSLIARVARQGGGRLVDMAVARLVPDTVAKGTTPKGGKSGGIGPGIATVAAAQLARRSVPAAIVIGGAVLAKHLYDRRREKAAAAAAREVSGDEQP
ncbi:MAG TPA: hypothetical protein PKD92_09560 [Novosphingobium sp.]|nr:hypothetical protein [Novosphingobium sp.]HMP56802.1 hypothetical protein [Novosphingobium sp.]